MITQKDFDLTIGELDHILSLLILFSDATDLDDANAQTLKHHAEDMLGAGNKILENLRIGCGEKTK